MSSVAENRKARYDYFIEETFQAGIKLQGWEVKAIRAQQISLQESYVISRDGALHLLNAHITPLIQASTHIKTEATRTRLLLLKKREIEKLSDKVKLGGYTIVPLGVYFKGDLVKVDIGLAKGKKQHDKRDVEKERDSKRAIDRAMKGDYRE